MNTEYKTYLTEHGLSADSFTYLETLAVTVSHEMPDKSFAFVGSGIPLLAAGLAQRTHAPELMVVFEAGTVGPTIMDMPMSVADPRVCYKAATLGTLVDAFGTTASRGFCTFGVLSAAECDMYGNLNSTCLGGRYYPAGASDDGRGPVKRLPGSGGANSIASLSDKVIAMMVHEKRRFTNKVSYLTTPAGMRGPAGETRFDYGLFRGGDLVVITDLCVMRPDPETGILYAAEAMPGVEADTIKDHTGWDIDVSRLKKMSVPTEEEIRILRMDVDPDRLFLDRKKK